ncbi:MAG: hypothetical protein MUC63_08520, partial [Planctomycetes bacterium]|nr:hypothetical protein [Planctomycetota bacterium]
MISRAYHIAFEKKLDPRLLMEIARRSGIGLKTHMGALDAETETKLREAVDEYGRQPLPPPEASAPAAPPAAADPSAPPPAAVSQPPG